MKKQPNVLIKKKVTVRNTYHTHTLEPENYLYSDGPKNF